MKIKSLILFVLLCFTMTILSSCTKGSFYAYNYAERYKAGDATYEEEIKSVNIDYISGSIEIIFSDTESCVNVIEDTDALEDYQRVHSMVMDNTLYVKFVKSSGDFFNIPEKKRLVVIVPTNITSLDVNGDSSSVEVRDLEIENINISSTSGSVSLENIDSSKISIDTVSGVVNLQKVQAKEAVIKTVSSATFIEGIILSKMDLSSVSGNFNIQTVPLTKEININTTSGDIYFSKMENTSFKLTLKTVSGRFDTIFPAVIVDESYVQNNGECIINFKSVSGSIAIR